MTEIFFPACLSYLLYILTLLHGFLYLVVEQLYPGDGSHCFVDGTPCFVV